MKKLGLLFTVVFMLIACTSMSAQAFKIVFVADPSVASNTTWLTKVATDWGATGICIRAIWGDMDNNSSQGVDTWTNFDAAINAITSSQYNGKDLDIYIRVSMGVKKPTWVAPGSHGLSNDDFQITEDGSLYDYGAGYPTTRRHPLNFTSDSAKAIMTKFFKDILHHINTVFPNKKNRIVEVVPSFSTDEESEYPYAAMCGYSSPEITAFRSYLLTKYNSTIYLLNQKWNPNNTWSNFSGFSSINPRNYNWDTNDNSSYQYAPGRTDWMNFRTGQLTNLISQFSTIASDSGFQMGIQFGSIYDSAIEHRGWFDPAKLVENVNSVHVADIYQYSDNFNFAADYLRTICKFWTITNNMSSNPVRFSTETNWPGYNGQSASFLSQKWTEQLVDYYNKGAYEHYLFGWDISTTTLDGYKTSYASWRNTLLAYSNQSVVTVNNQYAVHLGCEKVLFFNHNQQSANGKFAIYDSLTAHTPYSSNTANYNGDKDIITNYMIEKNPTYLNNYNSLYFTETSQYITEKAYLSLMKSSVTTLYANATWYSDSGHGEYAHTQGLYDEYLTIRSPIHLIWRSRTDLQAIWTDANLPAPGSGYTSDFVSWAYYNGCGYANQPTAREYPGWEIRDNGSTGNYKYDKNIRVAWNQSPTLQSTFPDAHYTNPVSNSNMIGWAKANLSGYSNWPYIGDGLLKTKSNKNINTIVPSEFTLSQNYPNPFNPTTEIEYSVPTRDYITLKVYDILGREVASLVNGFAQPGNYKVSFDGRGLSSGVYIYSIRSSTGVISKKLLLLK